MRLLLLYLLRGKIAVEGLYVCLAVVIVDVCFAGTGDDDDGDDEDDDDDEGGEKEGSDCNDARTIIANTGASILRIVGYIVRYSENTQEPNEIVSQIHQVLHCADGCRINHLQLLPGSLHSALKHYCSVLKAVDSKP